MKISAHTIVKNEERYIWFAIKSIIEFVDIAHVWDTGSSDKTPRIIERLIKLHPNKIKYKQLGNITLDQFPYARQQMVQEDNSDWFIILDGDEVWWRQGVTKLTSLINQSGRNLDSIVCSFTNPIGDIFHYQEEKAGFYNIDGKIGNHTIRAINRNIKGLHVENPYGFESYLDSSKTKIQDRPKSKRIHIGKTFMHLTHLPRSANSNTVMKRSFKLKYELGNPLPLDYFYPEVFFAPKPEFVPTPWFNHNVSYTLKAALITAPKKLKRRLTISPKIGY